MSPSSKAPQPATFYRADSYRTEESIGWLLKRIKQSIVRMADERLDALDLTHAQWGPMLRLRLSGASTTAALGRDLDIDAGALTRLLDRLEAKGLVQRERSSSDRRVVMVSLTEEGARATASLPSVLSEIFNAHLAGFTEAEWRTLIGLLQRIVANGEALREQAATDKS
ncbi:MarR family transcriptional regulator [Paucibacter sp. APW11]|uniref:MarR family transcriptional regulator n=1 Tax=Roseateles aquae TaxID=3077235 RepID=A0ABU3P808_9BURK|nr:MarR family transcriptional regulator [Paucibacter sp. APW11]MDT8998697.1 MarR family transcriptional regulator [Paucibacter sp. APW11]